jgi:hypothetical protein
MNAAPTIEELQRRIVDLERKRDELFAERDAAEAKAERYRQAMRRMVSASWSNAMIPSSMFSRYGTHGAQLMEFGWSKALDRAHAIEQEVTRGDA